MSFASLLLEIVFTRIFSAMMYYHFTFLAIALALFGVGASGVYVYVGQSRFPRIYAEHHLARYALFFATAAVLALLYVLAHPIAVIEGVAREKVVTASALFELFAFNAVAALPFFFAGVVVALAVTHFRESIDRVYAWDLVGASLAALAAGPLLSLLGGPTLVLGIAFLGAAGALLFQGARPLAVAGAAAAALLVAVNLIWEPIRVPSVKGVEAGRVVFEKWNAFSRVTAELVSTATYDIKIDAGAATRVGNWAGIARSPWREEISALAYSLFVNGTSDGAKTLVIGPGGGVDVVHALSAGAPEVTGVEINPIIATTIMRDRLKRESGGLYDDPRVRIVTDDGRSFVRRSRDRFDVIQGTLVDTWAATAAGAFALTENTLYTLEAFDDYYTHLTERGVLSFTRWRGGAEATRLILLAAGALERRGVSPGKTRGHLFYAVKGRLGTLVAKATPLTPDETRRLEEASTAGRFTVVLSPRTPGTHPLERLVDAGAWSSLARAEPEDVLPPSDDRPFFFYAVKPGELFDLGRHFGREIEILNPAMWLLLALGLTVSLLALVFMVLPLALRRPTGLSVWGLLYFGSIGLAFITLEIALLQKLTFFLGHPSFALMVVLFAMLAATGSGAYLSGRVANVGRLGAACGLVVSALAGLYALTLGPLLASWIAWPLPARIVVAVGLVALPGVFMGVMLPSGVRLLSRTSSETVPWGWGVNGATSVVGTVGATIFAIHFGYTATLLAGAAGYVAAAALVIPLAKRFEGQIS